MARVAHAARRVCAFLACTTCCCVVFTHVLGDTGGVCFSEWNGVSCSVFSAGEDSGQRHRKLPSQAGGLPKVVPSPQVNARRSSLLGGALILAQVPSALAEEAAAPAKVQAKETPALMLLRMAEITAAQEDMLLRIAKQTDGSLVVMRGSFASSVPKIIAKTQLVKNLDRLIKEEVTGDRDAARRYAEACVTSLRQIAVIEGSGSGPEFTTSELEQMAAQYAGAREQLRLIFEMLPAATQAQTKATARAVREFEREQLKKNA